MHDISRNQSEKSLAGMLATVRGVGKDVGHMSWKDPQGQKPNPAKTMWVTLHYIVWHHYFWFVFLHCFLRGYKEGFLHRASFSICEER